MLINGYYSKQCADWRNSCQTASDMFNKREKRASLKILNCDKKRKIPTVATIKVLIKRE